MINVSRIRLEEETEDFAYTVPEGSLVLDAGCGDQPYRYWFAHCRYESADFAQVPGAPYAKQITYVGDLNNIACESNRFDFILLHQVLEHVPYPYEVLSELYRVLKPGGKLLYSAPLFYEPHQLPYDFYRYTEAGVRQLMNDAGFRVDRLDWLEGYFGTIAYQLKGIARDLPWNLGGGILGTLTAPLTLAFKFAMGAAFLAFSKLEIWRKYTGSGYPKNYIAVVTKVPTLRGA